ncbi:MAG TPA: hypothetical protein PKY56_02080 [Candidatus Kapabacteria bacterium]|nr:hypothetical protein [Candidatus Kapabacteria bacterium]HPO61506.1 hypothetical protein [Candidatus Kapabacteria bacterium]
MLKIFRNIILGLLIFFVFITITIFILFQIHSFRSWVAEIALESVNNGLNGKIEIDDFHLNPFAGIEIENFRLLLENDTLARVEKLTVDFDIFDLIRGNLNFKYIGLDNPNIKLVRSTTDSTWNYEHIAKPSKPKIEEKKIPSKEPSKFALNIKYFEIKGLKLIYSDSILMQSSKNILTNANIQNLNLAVSAYIDLGKSTAALNLVNLKLEEKNFDFNLEKIKLLAFIKDNGVEFDELEIKTNDVDLSINSKIENFPLFNADSNLLNNAIISNLNLQVKSAHFLKFKNKFNFDFLPNFNKLDLLVKASGTLNDIRVNELNLDNGPTRINLEGRLKNLLDFENFVYSGKLSESTVNLNDLYPFPIPDKVDVLENIETVNIKSADVVGGLMNIDADLNISTKVGNINGEVGLTFAPKFSYNADITFNKFNLASLLKEESLKSSFNGTLNLKGSGEILEKLETNALVQLNNSEIFNLPIKNLLLNLKVQKPSLIMIDTLFTEFQQGADVIIDEFDTRKKPLINFKGWLDLKDFNNPKYFIETLFDDINIAKYSGNEELPTRLDASLKVDASGWTLDELKGNISTNIDYCEFNDKSLMPFSVDMNFEKDSLDFRNISIASNLFDAKIFGHFNFNSIISIIALQGTHLADFFLKKLEILNENKSDIEKNEELIKYENFTPAKLSVVSNIKDLTIINSFLDDVSIMCRANVDFDLDVSETSSNITIDSIDVFNFKFESKDLYITTWDMRIDGGFDMAIQDSSIHISKLELFAREENELIINENVIKNPNVYFLFENEKLLTELTANYNGLIDVNASGFVDFFDNYFDIVFNNFNLKYLDTLSWKNIEPIEIFYSNNNIDIKSLVLERTNAERINISGKYKFDSLDSLKIDVTNFPLSTIGVFSQDNKEMFSSMINGNIEQLSVLIDGKADNPIAYLNLRTNNILFNKDTLGIFTAELINKDAILTGKLKLNKDFNGNIKNLFNATIHSLPLDIALKDVKERFHNRNAIDISAESKDFPLSMLSGFIPVIKNPVGSIDLNFKATGFSFTDLNYVGNIRINPSVFLLEPNNMLYTADGEISIDYKSININKINLRNNPKDMQAGAAVITGFLNHKDFNIKDFDIVIKSKGIRLLSNASMRTMPTLYGDFDISTGNDSVRFSGTILKPFLTGFASILNANLIMPTMQINQMVQANVRYEYAGSNLKIHSVDFEKDDKKPEYIEKQTDFVTLMNYDLFVKFFGKMFLKMELGGIGQIVAEIGVKDKTKPLRVEMLSNTAPKLYDDIVIQENSSLTFLSKNFDISGTISFPTGSIANPGLNLKAIYNGKSYLDNVQRDFTVYLYLTGTKDYPNLRFDYILDNVTATGDSTTISEDALFLLIVGRTKAELMSGGQGQGNIISEGVSSGASALFSKYFTEILSNTPLNIQSADLDLSGGSFDQARIKLTGRLFGNVYWRVGGTVADLTNNNEVSIDLPLPIVLHPELFNNIIIQLTKSTNTSTIYNRSQKDWELKLKFGGSW